MLCPDYKCLVSGMFMGWDSQCKGALSGSFVHKVVVTCYCTKKLGAKSRLQSAREQ